MFNKPLFPGICILSDFRFRPFLAELFNNPLGPARRVVIDGEELIVCSMESKIQENRVRIRFCRKSH